MKEIIKSVESNTKSIGLMFDMIKQLQKRQDDLIQEIAKKIAKLKSEA